jgi:hypothetical protein
MWCRWKAGQSLHEIGRAFGKSHVVVHFLLARHGGLAPAARLLDVVFERWPELSE